jgi:hypothetical protein
MRKPLTLTLLGLAAIGCGTAPEPRPQTKVVAPPPKPVDETRRFPVTDQVSIELVNDKLLGKSFLPGGNIAQYKHGRKTYQQFLVHGKSPEDAAVLMFDYKQTLRDAKFIAHMGGYFGFDGDQPVYLFAKKSVLAGIVGLPEKDADVVARQFAAHLD